MVQFYVSQLRRVLAGNGAEIVTRGRGYELRLPAGEVDAVGRERLLEAGASPRGAGAVGGARRWPTWPTSRSPRPRSGGWRSCACARREQAINADLAAGLHAGVIGELEGLVAEHPLREQVHGQRMLALYRFGPAGGGA